MKANPEQFAIAVLNVKRMELESTLAERDKEIAELRAALNEAAQGYENLVAIGVLPIAYEEAVQELSNKYRAIAEDTK